ncbi:hypothetical protein Dcar01_02185 [Deinococcus carri]|uniref:Lipoprotein n=1 Tax=Deinococcus carri TaxID=1211323 RepID=A0ABP9W7W8_9DEIO
MKKLAPLALLFGLALSACGSAPGQLSGSRASVGLAVSDGGSFVTVTKTFTPATPEIPAVPPSGDNPGTPAVPAVPAKTTWTTGTPGYAEFTFTSRPGSDAVHITGYRIVRDVISTATGNYEDTSKTDINKLDIYVPSGWSCPERTSSQSCAMFTPTGGQRNDVVPAEGLPSSPYRLNLAGGLANLVIATNASVGRSTDIEFFGTSSSGQAVTVRADHIASEGVKTGDE